MKEARYKRLHVVGCSLCEIAWIGNSTEPESRLVVVRVWGGGHMWEKLLRGGGVLLSGAGGVSGLDRSGDCTKL